MGQVVKGGVKVPVVYKGNPPAQVVDAHIVLVKGAGRGSVDGFQCFGIVANSVVGEMDL